MRLESRPITTSVLRRNRDLPSIQLRQLTAYNDAQSTVLRRKYGRRWREVESLISSGKYSAARRQVGLDKRAPWGGSKG